MDTELVPPRLNVRAAPKRLSLSGDEHLAQLIRRGHEAAFAALYERYYQRLYRYCRSMLHNDADAQDALQSTFASVFSALSQGRRDAPMRPWLYRIAYNESVSVMRRRRPEVALTEAHEMSGVSTEELVAGRARLALLVADLRELTERQRGALVMRELSGLSHEEIATVFGISVGAAKQTIFEARRSLAEFAEGRAMACDEVSRAVSDGNGRVLRGRKLRAHLRECGSCAAFAAAIPARSRDLRAIAPPLSAVAAAGLLRRSLAAGSGHSAGGGGAAATGSGAATASTGAGSGAATAGGAGTGAVGTTAVGSGSATVAAGAVTKAAGLTLVAKAAVGVAVVATAAAGVAGAVNHFDSASSRGMATAKALRQSGHNTGSASQRSALAGTGHHATAAAAAVAAGRASGRAGARHRGRGHPSGHAHGSAASANAGALAHGNPRGATKPQGAASGVAGTKSPSASGGNASASNGHSAAGAAQSGQASSTHPTNAHRASKPTTSSHSITSRPSVTHPAHRLAHGSAGGRARDSSQPAHAAPAGSSAAGNSQSK